MAHDSDTRNIIILLYPVYGKLHGHLASQQPHASHVAHDDGSCTNRMCLCYKIKPCKCIASRQGIALVAC
jgi:hypothetical protein